MISVTDIYGSPMASLGDDNWVSSDGRIVNLLTETYGVHYWIKNLETDKYISISEYKNILDIDSRNDNFGKLFL